MAAHTNRYRMRASARDARGISLVELMVGLVIAMVSSLVIFQVFAVADARKRTTAAGSDAQVAGHLALYTLERDLKMAGYGFAATVSTTKYSNVSLLNCNVLGWNDALVIKDFALRLRPLYITQGAAGDPDSVEVLFSNSSIHFGPVEFDFSDNTTKRLKSRAGFNQGDLIVGVKNPTDPNPECALMQVTQIPNPNDPTDHTIKHNQGSYVVPFSSPPLTLPTVFNRPDALGPRVAFGSEGVVFNMGSAPVSLTWSVVGTQLRQTASGLGAASNVVAEGITNLQAQYGIDLNNSGIIEPAEWRDAEPANTAEWRQLKAIRVAILARSGEYERNGPATANAPRYFVDSGAAFQTFTMKHLDGSAGAGAHADPTLDWRNYRYRVYETVVALRNMVWGVPF